MTGVNNINVTAEVLRDMVDEERIVYNWQQIESQRKRQAKGLFFDRQRLIIAMAALLLSAVALIVYSMFQRSLERSAPLSFELSESTRMFAVPSAAPSERRIPLSDGSTITLAPGASLEVMENTATLFRTTLHQGWVRYNVIPGHQRKWEVDTGLCRVIVLGTQFTVSYSHESVHVAVHRGVVAVYSADGTEQLASLIKGNDFTITRSQLSHLPKQPLVAQKSCQDTEIAPNDETTGVGNISQDVHRKLKAGGRTRVGRKSKRNNSSLVGLGGSEDVNALLRQVDMARQQHQPRKAARLLNQIITEYPTDQAVGLVALTLGKIQLDALDQPAKAAMAFRRAADSKGLPLPLKEQAVARSVEAYTRAKNFDNARSMADTYHRLYPDGNWAALIERWTATRQ